MGRRRRNWGNKREVPMGKLQVSKDRMERPALVMEAQRDVGRSIFRETFTAYPICNHLCSILYMKLHSRQFAVREENDFTTHWILGPSLTVVNDIGNAPVNLNKKRHILSPNVGQRNLRNTFTKIGRAVLIPDFNQQHFSHP
mmetsp:Transcript_14642/g.35662  ORF Transcript_14642/g.35662 Transcript_14642/m.35662 type:complete len:142 (+) Transcript_14642:1292-1717(+)